MMLGCFNFGVVMGNISQIVRETSFAKDQFQGKRHLLEVWMHFRRALGSHLTAAHGRATHPQTGLRAPSGELAPGMAMTLSLWLRGAGRERSRG